jgi:hypothetical protein
MNDSVQNALFLTSLSMACMILLIAHNLINTNTVNGIYNITECRSQITNTSTSTVIYHNTDTTTHPVPRASLQSYLGMTIINNTSVQNYQFYLITYFAGTYQILSGTASNSTYLQFTKIG